MKPFNTAIATASIPLILGAFGLLKIGRLDWAIAGFTILASAFVFYGTLRRAKKAEKLGGPYRPG